MYWTPLQLDIYKDIIKLNNAISIDGSIAQKIFRTNGTSHPIFLYVAVASGVSGIIRLFQLLTEKHDANLIQYWINE